MRIGIKNFFFSSCFFREGPEFPKSHFRNFFGFVPNLFFQPKQIIKKPLFFIFRGTGKSRRRFFESAEVREADKFGFGLSVPSDESCCFGHSNLGSCSKC